MDLVFSNAGSSSCFLLLSCFWSKDVREVAVARHFSSRSSRVGLGRCVHPGLAFARTHHAEPRYFGFILARSPRSSPLAPAPLMSVPPGQRDAVHQALNLWQGARARKNEVPVKVSFPLNSSAAALRRLLRPLAPPETGGPRVIRKGGSCFLPRSR